jgi:glycosyltransferase involved in cell wall biosynthesis
VSVPAVSVVIPCHNAEAWIGETIASVAIQEGVAVEAIVVDDGSEDASADAARAAAGHLPLAIIRQPRGGASRARNAGTRAASGAFVQYLDADDVLLPGTLACRIDALSGGGDVAYCDWIRWEAGPGGAYHDGETVARTLGGRPEIDLLLDAWWPPGALLFRRTLVERILPWREDLPVIQDARFLQDAALAGAVFVHVPHTGLRYRSHPDSLSRRDSKAFVDDVYRNGLDLQAAWERDGSLDEDRRRCLVRIYSHVARAVFARDRAAFDEVVARLKALEPGYVPDGPAALRAVAQVVGYPRAEYVAAAWRRLKLAAR